MTTDSLFAPCTSCGKSISTSATKCDGCGKRQRKLSLIHWLGIGFFGLIVFAIVSAPESGQATRTATTPPPAPTVALPEIQQRFISAVSKHQEMFTVAKNEIQQSVVRDRRRDAIAEALNGLSIKSWVGTVRALETNSDGKGILSIEIAPGIEIKTWNNALSDFDSNTLIDKNSELYGSLFDLEVGQKVRFSGRFFSSELDSVEETSITIDGSMRSPEFLFKFSSVQPVK